MRWFPPPMSIVDIELLEVVECSGLEPAVNHIELAVYIIVIEVDARKVEAAGGSRVLREDLGDDAETLANIVAERVASLKVERRGLPEVAPPVGEDLCTGAAPCGEEGDDDVEEDVGEAADKIILRHPVVVAVATACPLPFSTASSPFGSALPGGGRLLHDWRPAS